MIDIDKYSYEEIANALYRKGKKDGYSKVTDKTKWREPVAAEKLEHVAHKKISAGSGTLEYGSDAKDEESGVYAEYKSKAIEDKELRNLFQRTYGKSGRRYVPLTISGIYNGAYTSEAIDEYEKIDHYFGVFYEELCVYIIKVDTKYVIKTLRNGLLKMTKGKPTNLNTVKVNLGDTHLYDVAYKNETWWDENE